MCYTSKLKGLCLMSAYGFFLKTLIITVLWISSIHAKETKPLVITCDSLGKKKEECIKSVHAFESETGIKVTVVEMPTGSSNRLAWILPQLASQSSDIDIYLVDTTWPGMLANHFIDLKPYISEETLKQYHPSLINNNTVDGKLIAMPWYIDMGLLFYRKDLLDKYKLPVPTTWKELESTAKIIQDKERAAGNDKMWGFVFSGKAFEGLTCNAIEWLTSHNAQIVDQSGCVVVNNPKTLNTLKRIQEWIGYITPPGALNYAEEDSRGVFQSGNAVFMRHWPYTIALVEAPDSPIRGKVGIAPLPKGDKDGKSASILGGWQLAVSKYSKNPAQAAEMVKFLTGRKELKDRAVRADYYPPYMDLYQDDEVKKVIIHADLILKALEGGVARPAAIMRSKYNQASSAIWNTIHKVFLKKETPEQALINLEKQLNIISRKGKRWIRGK